jgi:hypothetical protein
MVGLSAGILFAAGKGGFDFIDLDSIHLLHHRRRYDDISIEGDRYVIGRRGRRQAATQAGPLKRR